MTSPSNYTKRILNLSVAVLLAATCVFAVPKAKAYSCVSGRSCLGTYGTCTGQPFGGSSCGCDVYLNGTLYHESDSSCAQ
jgi:hypothetical protein